VADNVKTTPAKSHFLLCRGSEEFVMISTISCVIFNLMCIKNFIKTQGQGQGGMYITLAPYIARYLRRGEKSAAIINEHKEGKYEKGDIAHSGTITAARCEKFLDSCHTVGQQVLRTIEVIMHSTK
jgi:hypothetical protein